MFGTAPHLVLMNSEIRTRMDNIKRKISTQISTGNNHTVFIYLQNNIRTFWIQSTWEIRT